MVGIFDYEPQPALPGPALFGWRYIGNKFMPGIPARDITAEEAQERGWTEQLNNLTELYAQQSQTEEEE